MSDNLLMCETRNRSCIDDEDEDMELVIIVVSFISMVATTVGHQRKRKRQLAWNEHERVHKRALWMDTLKNNTKCIEQLRFSRPCYEKLCRVLRSMGGLVTSRNVIDEEVVAFFLHILAHNLKNRTIQALFARSGETVSRQFHIVLRVVLKIGKYYIKEVDQGTTFAHDGRWKWFEGAQGALDGTHVKMTVPLEDRCRYRDRKGDISTNVLATCDPQLCFTYILPGWEGSASDTRIIRDALQRPRNNLKVPNNKYFLVDLGYTNSKGFLAPYRGTRFHLNLWRGNTPTNYKELFNLRHSSARNTIERAYGCVKKQWAILRTSSFFPKSTQVRIINACAILPNFLRTEQMEETNLISEVEQEFLNAEEETLEGVEDNIISTRQSNEWDEFRDKLAKEMWDNYFVRIIII